MQLNQGDTFSSSWSEQSLQGSILQAVSICGTGLERSVCISISIYTVNICNWIRGRFLPSLWAWSWKGFVTPWNWEFGLWHCLCLCYSGFFLRQGSLGSPGQPITQVFLPLLSKHWDQRVYITTSLASSCQQHTSTQASSAPHRLVWNIYFINLNMGNFNKFNFKYLD